MRADDFFRELEAERPELGARWAVEEPSVILAVNVSRMRHDRGWSQRHLAIQAGLKQPKIAQIERGDANPELKTLARLAVAFGVETAEILAVPSDAANEKDEHAAELRTVSAEAFHSGTDITVLRWDWSGAVTVSKRTSQADEIMRANENFALAS